ncbi:amino-acid N-acetyltransferase [Candidatus Nitrosacidococcus sp. I8]|uniref:amino-acid N-acetyltransferase n=1 Tax=Candidatus Nitrosacidococcus sp. I8 TaxID=2942908 RepID=UPI002226F67E|nr:amino-acid N-acetyltransferase [Candidatus Nitrosacidococcus sp. I8]CAH9019233.1 Amino-acid acetyltransferase [Candidatus Nitrosacidococcus sp. I8]
MANSTHLLPEIHWLRNSSPYIYAHRGKTFVISFSGAFILDARFLCFVQDIALLYSLGIRIVLVHGAETQIENILTQNNLNLSEVNGIQIIHSGLLPHIKAALGATRIELESLFSIGLTHSFMVGMSIQILSGNFITARPLGVRGGVDYCHRGEIRKIDINAIQQSLNQGSIVLISPIGYSPTGESFYLDREEIAAAIAIAMGADKLIFMMQSTEMDSVSLPQELSPTGVTQFIQSYPKLHPSLITHLLNAAHASQYGVKRVHIINKDTDGALLMELFKRDGVGILITNAIFEDTRKATIEDVGGILELITPLEQKGLLVRRPREQLETEIHRFIVMERDKMIIACAALYPFAKEKVGELACLVVHPEYRKSGRATALLATIEKAAKQKGLNQLCVLTTQTFHWFQERGFVLTDLEALPENKRALYNYQRNSKILIKPL